MALQIELPPDVEARLAEAAEARGMALPDYAATLLSEAAWKDEQPRRTAEDLERFVAAMASDADRLPDLPTSSFSRESFYKPE